MLNFHQGETIKIEIEVNEKTGEASTLTGVTAIFAYKNGATLIKKQMTIAENVVSVTLLEAETALLSGVYAYEVKLQDINLAVDMIVKDRFIVNQSLFPVFELEVV